MFKSLLLAPLVLCIFMFCSTPQKIENLGEIAGGRMQVDCTGIGASCEYNLGTGQWSCENCTIIFIPD